MVLRIKLTQNSISFATLLLTGLGAALGFLPLVALNLRTGRFRIVEAGILLFLGLTLRFKPLRVFFLVSVLCYFTNYDRLAFIPMYTLLLYALCFDRLSSMDFNVHWVINMCRSVFICQIGYCVMQFFNVATYFNKGIITGTLGSTTDVASFLVFLSPLFMRGRWLLCLIPMFWVLWVTQSTGAVLVFSIVAMAQLFRSRQNIAILVFIIIFFALFASINEPIADKFHMEKGERFLVWKEAIELWFQNPKTFLIGYGLGQFKALTMVIFNKIRDVEITGIAWYRLHNDPLQIAVESGIIGLLSFLSLCLGFVFTPGMKEIKWCLFAFLLLSLYTFPFQLASHSVIALILASSLNRRFL